MTLHILTPLLRTWNLSGSIEYYTKTLGFRCARICYLIETFEYGTREFAIYDNNGYVLQFGQELQAEPAPSAGCGQ
jgi:hypothetical protein